MIKRDFYYRRTIALSMLYSETCKHRHDQNDNFGGIVDGNLQYYI